MPAALPRLAAALLCAFAAASAVHAQQQRAPRSVQAVPNPVPSAAALIAQSAPKPTGLMPRFPAGISSGSGAAVSTDPLAANTTPIPAAGSTVTTTQTPSELPPAELFPSAPGILVPRTTTLVTPGVTTPSTVATNVLGAGATVRGPGQTAGGAGGFSATDQARSWFFADANHDGGLTRAEFSRLSIATMSFEEMDRNYDGVISRFEYEDSLR